MKRKNPAATVDIVVLSIHRSEVDILLIQRKYPPYQGTWALPGGFIDPGETAEQGAIREIKEELKIEVGPLEYLGSYPNTYEFKNVSYRSCDLLFYCRIESFPMEFDETEAEELLFMDPFEINEDEVAFDSIRMGLRLFRRLKSSGVK